MDSLNLNCNQQLWSELFCCVNCKNVFSKEFLPVNLVCNHLMCDKCTKCKDIICPLDKMGVADYSNMHYVNGPVLSIVSGQNNLHWLIGNSTLKAFGEEISQSLGKIEASLYQLTDFLYKTNYEKVITISSNRISRTIQQKLLSLLCTNILTREGRIRLQQILRSICERIVSELVLHIQNNTNLSSSLWSAVRARGCQFLGPVMQDDVLKLICRALCKGELIARKTLVIYVVQSLISDYAQISKTCVGHVVQLLYRASCFNVIKRDGQSSLMQLKEPFREFVALRAEHDAQIVQIAMETGLRISTDQWSSLLYGDCRHRAYMQTICDRLSTNSLKLAMEELQNLLKKQSERDVCEIDEIFPYINCLIAEGVESLLDDIDWTKLANFLNDANYIITIYAKFTQRRYLEKEHRQEANFSLINKQGQEHSQAKSRTYCRDVNCIPQQISQRIVTNRPTSRPYSMDFGCRPPPLSLLSYPSAPPQIPSLTNYLESSMSIPIGSPPNFTLPPMSYSPTQIPMGRKDSGVGLSQHDSLETMSTTLVPVLPVSPVISRYVDTTMNSTNTFSQSASTSPTTFYSNRPSIILFGNNSSSPVECTTFTNPTTIIGSNQSQTGTAILSTSPPTYQLNNNGLISSPAYPIPIQSSQPLIFCGSTPTTSFPFGSPPLLFPQWVTPLDSGATFTNLIGTNLFDSSINGLSSCNSHSAKKLYGSDNENHKSRESSSTKSRRSSGNVDEEPECHVSFTVATSVLSDEKLSSGSLSSSWTLKLTSQSNISIPLTSQNLNYTVARDPMKSGICKIIRSVNASMSTSLIKPMAVLTPFQELNTKLVKNLSISS